MVKLERKAPRAESKVAVGAGEIPSAAGFSQGRQLTHNVSRAVLHEQKHAHGFSTWMSPRRRQSDATEAGR